MMLKCVWRRLRTRDEFETTFARINAGGTGRPLRVALVADMHCRPGAPVLRALSGLKVDLIAVAGDLMELRSERALPDDALAPRRMRVVYSALTRLDGLFGKLASGLKRGYDNENAYEFLCGASKLAPTCYAPGNHERGMTPYDRAAIARTGAILLDNADITLRTGEYTARVGGLSTRADADWLAAFARATGCVKILICHHPEYYGRYVPPNAFDAVLSGHAHGGQWRVFGRPLFAPGQGLFPKYADGVYDNTLVVSRGLSNTAHVPRFGNRTQLVIVDIS